MDDTPTFWQLFRDSLKLILGFLALLALSWGAGWIYARL